MSRGDCAVGFCVDLYGWRGVCCIEEFCVLRIIVYAACGVFCGFEELSVDPNTPPSVQSPSYNQ